jgi:hypothetical protein
MTLGLHLPIRKFSPAASEALMCGPEINWNDTSVAAMGYR